MSLGDCQFPAYMTIGSSVNHVVDVFLYTFLQGQLFIHKYSKLCY